MTKELKEAVERVTVDKLIYLLGILAAGIIIYCVAAVALYALVWSFILLVLTIVS